MRNDGFRKIEKAKMGGYVAGKSVGKIDLIGSWLELSESDFHDYVKRDLILLLESHFKSEEDYRTYIANKEPLQMSAKILKLLECETPSDFRQLISDYRREEDYFLKRYHDERSYEYQEFENFLERSFKVGGQE